MLPVALKQGWVRTCVHLAGALALLIAFGCWSILPQTIRQSLAGADIKLGKGDRYVRSR